MEQRAPQPKRRPQPGDAQSQGGRWAIGDRKLNLLSPITARLTKETLLMLQSVLRALQLPDLRRRILFTLLMLLVFRLIAHIPVPNIDPSALATLQQALRDNQLAALLNIFAGGALQNLAVA